MQFLYAERNGGTACGGHHLAGDAGFAGTGSTGGHRGARTDRGAACCTGNTAGGSAARRRIK